MLHGALLLYHVKASFRKAVVQVCGQRHTESASPAYRHVVVLAELLVFGAERVLDVAELVHDGRVLVQEVWRRQKRHPRCLAKRRERLLRGYGEQRSHGRDLIRCQCGVAGLRLVQQCSPATALKSGARFWLCQHPGWRSPWPVSLLHINATCVRQALCRSQCTPLRHP